MNFGIAISTAATLVEQLVVERVSSEITCSILDDFSNTMLNFQKELVHQSHLRSMENILLKGKENTFCQYIYIILT